MKTHLIFLLLTGLLFTSCDTQNDELESEFLTMELKEVQFEVDRIQPTSVIRVGSDVRALFDIGPLLSTANFNKSDIVRAQVTDARLNLVFPTELNFTIIEDVELVLASATSSSEVASMVVFTEADRSNVEMLLSKSDITSVLQSPDFQAILEFHGTRDLEERVSMEAFITIELEVQPGRSN